MSPKSRGRKGRNKKKSGKPPKANPRSATAVREPLILDDMVAIAGHNVAFQHAVEHALQASAGLLDAAGPRQLEQATAELLAAELADPMMRGRRSDMLCRDLVEAACDRVLSDIAWNNDTWRGPWRLLHGLASIGPRGDGKYAAEVIAAAQVPEKEPDWAGVPGISVTGEAYELRDKWGLRLGVIAEFAYPGGVDPHVYLLGVDASWDIAVREAGVFDDVAAAAAAWRASQPAGESVAGIEPLSKKTLACLYEMAHLEELMSRDELLTEHYRAERRINDILARFGSGQATAAFEPDPDEFTAWYRARHGHDPEDDLAAPLAEEWIQGAAAGTAHLVSPRRSAGFYDHFLAWIDADEDDVRVVLPEWIRWVGEKAGAVQEMIDESVAATLPH